MRLQKFAAALVFVGLASCNWDEGPCYLRDDVEGGGVGGGPIAPGWGGYGEAPPEPQGADEGGEPIECSTTGGTHHCKEPGSNACVDRCEAIGAYCPNYAHHPRKPEVSDGALYMCHNSGAHKWECSFKYPNGDKCLRAFPDGTWLCY